MNNQEKKQLYEAIILDVAKVVKRYILEMSANEERPKVNSLVENFILSVSKMNQTELNKLKRNLTTNLNESVESAAEMILNNQSSFKKLNKDELGEPADFNADFKYSTIQSTCNSLYKDRTIEEYYSWPFGKCITFDDIEFLDIILPKSIVNDFIEEMSAHQLYPKVIDNEIQDNLKYLINNFHDEEIVSKLKSNDFKKEISLWTYIRFLPIEQKNIREELEQDTRYLYHYTLNEYLEGIQHTGLIPSNTAHPTYPKRVFLVTPARNKTTIDRMKELIKNSSLSNVDFNIDSYTDALLRSIAMHVAKRKGSFKNIEFSKITIDLNKVPANVEFHWDMNSLPFGVYTESNIPANAIVDVEKCNFRMI